MSETSLELHRCNPANWYFGFYFCRADPRIWVRKRWLSLGWTLNLARPWAIPAFIGVLLILVLAIELAAMALK